MWCQTIRKFLLKFILIICHSEYQRVFYLFIFKWTQSQAKQHTTAHPLLFGEMTEKSGRPKARKLVGQDKNSLITEGNRNKKKQLFRGNHPPLPTSRPMLNQSLSNGYLLKIPLPSVFITEGGITGQVTSLWSIWVSYVHSQLVAHPSLLAMKAE